MAVRSKWHSNDGNGEWAYLVIVKRLWKLTLFGKRHAVVIEGSY